MEIADRQMQKWTNPYVADGLVFAYDSIWNSGWNRKDDELRITDLTGRFGDIFVDLNKDGWKTSHNKDINIPIDAKLGLNDATLEVVYCTNAVDQPMIMVNSSAWTVGFWSSMQNSNITYKQYFRNGSSSSPAYPQLYDKYAILHGTITSHFDEDTHKWKHVGYSFGQKRAEFTQVASGSPYDFSYDCVTCMKFDQKNIDLASIKFIRLYNRELSHDEILRNYEIDRRRFGI